MLQAISLRRDQESGAAAVVGKRIENTAEFTGSLFFEYRVPNFSGLSFNAGVFHIGDRAVNAANNAFVPSYTLYDVGASYETEFAGRPMIYRVTGENITGKEYWAATGSNLLAQGLPAAVKLSISTEF